MARRKDTISIKDIKRYQLGTLRYLLSTNKFTALQKRTIRKKLPRTKLEKQWWDIRARYGYQIKKSEFEEYYYLSRKVKRKIKTLTKEGKIYAPPEISTGIGTILSRGVKYFRNKLAVLKSRDKRNWRKTYMTNIKFEVCDKLRAVFGETLETLELINRILQLTDKELTDFLDENKDLAVIPYASPEYLRKYFDKINMTVNKINLYLDSFATKYGLDV